MVQLLWETVWQFLNELHIEFQYDPALPLLGTHPNELKTGIQGLEVYGSVVMLA